MNDSDHDVRGLTETEAQARLHLEGFNELPQQDRRTPFRIVAEVMREPMLALLVGGGLVYLRWAIRRKRSSCSPSRRCPL